MPNLILARGSDFPKFRRGSVTFHMFQTVRPLTFSPIIEFYRGQIDPEDAPYKPLNFRKGRITARLVYGSRNLLLTHSQEVQFVSGRIGIQTTGLPSVGALTDFAIYPSTALADPADLLISDANAPVSGGVTQPYQRLYATFAVGKGARYVGVGAKFMSVPNTGEGRIQYIKKVQLEKAYPGASLPTSWEPARQINVVVKPDRLNHSPNPGFSVDTTDWTGVTRVANSAAASGFSGDVTLAGGASATVTHTVQVRAEKDYVAAVYATSDVPITVNGISVSNVPTRILTAFSGPPEGAFVANLGLHDLNYAVGPASAPTTVRFFSMLVEEGTVPGSYFDGSTNADTIWESGDTTGKARSYYYKNRADRYAAIKRILESNAPMGVGIGEPVFGTLPAD